MSLTRFRIAVLATLVAVASGVAIAAPSKEACVEAHSRGQDARDAGKLSLARKLFLSCAQTSCPTLVQSDCAKFANDLDQQQPTLTFAARDSSGNDLPDTSVYVDDVLVVTRLDDGLPHDADPGQHIVKFQNNGRDQVITIVLNSGEKGRAVVAKFPAIGGDKPTPGAAAAAPSTMTTAVTPVAVHAQTSPTTKHPAGAKLSMLGGGVALIAGATLAILGNSRIPGDCSASTHTCAAPPGDPQLTTASNALKLEDLGIGIGAVGAAALIAGAVWYFTGSHTEREPTPAVTAGPWLSPNSVGLTLSGQL